MYPYILATFGFILAVDMFSDSGVHHSALDDDITHAHQNLAKMFLQNQGGLSSTYCL